MSSLYPLTFPIESGLLPVSQLHSIYYKIFGLVTGVPILFVHGGPGSGTLDNDRYSLNILIDREHAF